MSTSLTTSYWLQVTFRAVAATPGSFALPPAKAYAAQEPELMGLSAAGGIEVCVPPCSALPAAPPPAPKQCPNDCSGNGACDTSSGTCLCDARFGYEDCSVYDAAA